MKKRIISILKYCFFLFIGLALVWWQISGMTGEEKEQFLDSITHVRYIYVGPIVLMGLLSHLFRALRWKLLIEPIKKVSSKNAFYSLLVGYLGNTFIPRAGEILRCTLLGKYEKIPFAKLIGTVIAERTFDLLCYLFVIILTVLIQLRAVRDFIAERTDAINNTRSMGSSWVYLLIILSAIAIIFFIFNRLFHRFSHNRYIVKIKGLWDSLKEGVGTILHLKRRRAFIGYTLLMWAMYLLQVYLGFRTIDATTGLGLGAALSVLTLSTLAMIVSPGGLGAFPVAIQQVLLVYHIKDISFGWLVWGVNTAIIILAGSISFILLTRKRNNL